MPKKNNKSKPKQVQQTKVKLSKVMNSTVLKKKLSDILPRRPSRTPPVKGEFINKKKAKKSVVLPKTSSKDAYGE